MIIRTHEANLDSQKVFTGGAEVCRSGQKCNLTIGYHSVYPTRLFTVNLKIPKLLLQLESRSEQMPIEGS